MKTLLTTALLFIALTSFAQRPNHEQLKSLKIAYITEQLELTPSEAQVFWPIYNVFDQEMESIRKAERAQMKMGKRDFKTVTEAEAKEILTVLKDGERRKADAHIQLVTQLKDKLSYKKTLILLQAEEGFKRKLLRELRDRRGKEPRN